MKDSIEREPEAPLRTDGGSAIKELLTPREAQVLRELALGATARRTAAVLGVSLHTVQTHTKHLYRKLGITGRSQATLAAVRLGLVQP